MPIYEYLCNNCGNVVELFFHSAEKGKKAEDDGILCSKCNNRVSKVLSCFKVEKVYPILGSRGSAFAGGSESNRARKPGFKRYKTGKKN